MYSEMRKQLRTISGTDHRVGIIFFLDRVFAFVFRTATIVVLIFSNRPQFAARKKKRSGRSLLNLSLTFRGQYTGVIGIPFLKISFPFLSAEVNKRRSFEKLVAKCNF